MNIVEDILDNGQIELIRNFIFNNTYNIMLFYGDGPNGKSVISKTIPNSINISLYSLQNNIYDDDTIFIANDNNELYDIINYVQNNPYYKLIIVTNCMNVVNYLNDENNIIIMFKYRFVAQINRQNDKLSNTNIYNQINTNNIWEPIYLCN